MRSLSSLSFFLLFEQILRRDNPGFAKDRWSAFGVDWQRARHTFAGHQYGFAVDTFTASHEGEGAWTLLVAKEQWWAGKHDDATKLRQWARPLRGNRKNILAWFAMRKTRLQK